MQVPEDLREFLRWVKTETEADWQISREEADDDKWIEGAKWQGLQAAEIGEIEQQYGIKFSPEHRVFLEVLHSIDKLEPEVYYTEEGEETRLTPYFYHWQRDEEAIKARFQWPYDTIFQDVLGQNGIWLKSWGKRPKTDEEKEAKFAEWYQQAPTLVPIYGHRFVVTGEGLAHQPVLSVWGSDIIVYGWNIKQYLLSELGNYLPIWKNIFDEEDQEWYSETIPEVQQLREQEFKLAPHRAIPFWKELMLIWSSGWSSFGLESPNKVEGSIQPITKTYTPDEDDNDDLEQKRFTDF